MSDVCYHDNINFIFKIPIHFVLECVEIEVTVWTGSKGQLKVVNLKQYFVMKNNVPPLVLQGILVSSVGRVLARQSGGCRFKSRSSKFFIVTKVYLKMCPVSFPCGLLHDIYRKKLYPFMVHPLTASSQVVL